MRIIGLDAAADLANFGCVVCRYAEGTLELEDERVLRDQAGVVNLARSLANGGEQTLIAIDAPLGWPAPLGACLSKHQAGQPLPKEANDLFRRETDRWVKRVVRKQSLDIGADKIARAAWQALDVLERLRSASGHQIPLAWRPDFEVPVAVIDVSRGFTEGERIGFDWLQAPSAWYQHPTHVEPRLGIAGAVAFETGSQEGGRF